MKSICIIYICIPYLTARVTALPRFSGLRYKIIFLTMQSVFQLIYIYSSYFIVILGMILNKFIVLMNGKTWMRNKCLPTGDTIVTSLCLSRWSYQCLLVVHQTFDCYFPEVYLDFFYNLCSLVLLLLNYVSIWLASLLCVYYCLKITNYKNVVFLYLKVRMSRLVPWGLGLCVFFSFVPLLPFACIAFFLTVPSLWRHMRNMSGTGTGFRNPDMKTHYNAIKSMTAFFLLHILFIIAINIYLSGVLEYKSPYRFMMAVVGSLYPCLHSGVIIFYNRKLREGFLFPITYVLSYLQKKADP
ncbi:taste receptor type 2 member 7-like [Rana temporaria]|uniref:taste receptor type 2 member 7-like n=1 Tax=Rana temporaria TaxID=8407 RepID=UPI001AADCAB9|nr:taste receptor type 2 member 7-like [Rana temporaria]